MVCRRRFPVLGAVMSAALVFAAWTPDLLAQNDLRAPASVNAAAAASESAVSTDEMLRPPQGCRGGKASGAGSVWALEFVDAGSFGPRKGWSGSWQEWTEGLNIAPRGGPPLIGRVRTLDNWGLLIQFERDGAVLAREVVRYLEPCVYASQDQQDNVFTFYRQRS